MQLERDLARADIKPFAWIVNQTLTPLNVTDPVLRARRAQEAEHLQELVDHAPRLALEPWGAGAVPQAPSGVTSAPRIKTAVG
jgi:arsenite-transporting ATPase